MAASSSSTNVLVLCYKQQMSNSLPWDNRTASTRTTFKKTVQTYFFIFIKHSIDCNINCFEDCKWWTLFVTLVVTHHFMVPYKLCIIITTKPFIVYTGKIIFTFSFCLPAYIRDGPGSQNGNFGVCCSIMFLQNECPSQQTWSHY